MESNWVIDLSQEKMEENNPVFPELVNWWRYDKTGICRLITEMGQLIGLNSVMVQSTAQIYWHRFFLVQSFQHYDACLMATTALFLANKVEEHKQKFKVHHFVSAYCHFQKKTDCSTTVFDELCLAVIKAERILLCTISFDVVVLHPHRFVDKYIMDIRKKIERRDCRVQISYEEIRNYTIFFLNDAMTFGLCILIPPKKLAAAVVYLSFSFFENLSNASTAITCRQDWEQHLGLNYNELADNCGRILEMYLEKKNSLPNDFIKLFAKFPIVHCFPFVSSKDTSIKALDAENTILPIE